MKAYRHLETFDGRSSFSTWLRRIAINSALMELRRKRARPVVSMEFPDGDTWRRWEVADRTKDTERHYLERETTERLKQASCRLPSSLRTLLEIHLSSGGTIQDTAERAGISIAATKSRLFRAKAVLRKALDEGSNTAI